MAHLTYRNLQKVQNCIREIYSNLDIKSLPTHIISVTSKVIPSSIAAIHAITPNKQKMAISEVSSNAVFTAVDAFNRHIHEHPIVGLLFSGKVKPHRFRDDIERGLLRKRRGPNAVTKISDMLTNSQFRSLALFNEFYRPNGIEYQLGMPLLLSKDFQASLSLNRDKVDFSEEERLILNILRPHIIQAFKNAEAYAALAALSINGNSGVSAQSLSSLGLTHREADVLYWVAQGKTNADVSVILNMASGTVKRHLEDIYQKVGVENRTAAAMLAMEFLR